MTFEKHPWRFTLCFCAMGYALVHFLVFGGWGLSVFCLYALCALLWQILSPRRQRGWGWLVAGAGCSLSFVLWEQSFLWPLLSLFIPLCLVLWVTGGLPQSSRHVPGQLLPFHLLPAAFIALGAGLKERRKLGRIAFGAALSLPLLFVVSLLLASAEDAFRDLLSGLVKGLGEGFPLLAVKLMLTLLVVLYLCCLSLSEGRKNRVSAAAPTKGDPLVVSVVLGLLCALYLVFLLVSFRPLAALAAPTPGLLSHYARKGFFELCVAAAINLGVFLTVNRFEGMKKGAPRILSLTLAVMTLLLIALACFKMGLYIRFCGLTLLRFYTSCFMAVMALFFILLAFSLFKPLPVMRLGAGMLAAALLILSLTDVGGFIASSNAERYLSGDLASLDISQYRLFPAASAPALFKVYKQTQSLSLWRELHEFFTLQPAPHFTTLWETSLQTLEAQKIFALLRP